MSDFSVHFVRGAIEAVPNGTIFIIIPGQKGFFVWLLTDIYKGKDAIPPKRVLCVLERHHSAENGVFVARAVDKEKRERLLGTRTNSDGITIEAIGIPSLKPFVQGKIRLRYGDRRNGDGFGCVYEVGADNHMKVS